VRILILNYEFPPVGGGGGVATFQLARQWARDHEVDCLTSHMKGLRRREVIDGVCVHRVPVLGRRRRQTASLLSMLCYPASGLMPALALCRRRGYDVVNTHFAIPTGPLGAAVSALWGVPNVVSVHGGDVYDPTKRLSPHRFRPTGFVVRQVLRRAALIVAQSSDTARRVVEYYGRNLAAKVRIVPLPFEPPAEPVTQDRTELRRELDLDASTTYLISVGRLVRRKAYDRLIEGLAFLPAGVALVLVGDGPLRDELAALAREQGLADRVRMAGYVSERDKYRYLAAADVFVLSSHHEGFGIALQEAMHAGLPIVATSCGGQTDLLEQGVNALLVESNEPEVLADAVKAIIGQAPLRRRMSRQNRQKVRLFAPEPLAARYVEVFREAAARKIPAYRRSDATALRASELSGWRRQ